MRKFQSTMRKSQAGAALITSILILLMLTIIGVAAMQMTSMQERMAGNSRDLTLAFQGAEAALRNGEVMISKAPGSPTTCKESPCDVWAAGLALLVNPAGENTEWWGKYAMQYEAKGTYAAPSADKEFPDLQEDPRFIVQWVTRVPDSLTVGEGSGPPPGRDFYRVTGRSTGGSGKANTVLQSTYARR